MARANRVRGQGGVFHVTHRCHNGRFVLRFARDRDVYRAKLRAHLPEFEGSLLDDCVSRQETALEQKDDEVWILQESPAAYGLETASKNASGGLN